MQFVVDVFAVCFDFLCCICNCVVTLFFAVLLCTTYLILGPNPSLLRVLLFASSSRCRLLVSIACIPSKFASFCSSVSNIYYMGQNNSFCDVFAFPPPFLVLISRVCILPVFSITLHSVEPIILLFFGVIVCFFAFPLLVCVKYALRTPCFHLIPPHDPLWSPPSIPAHFLFLVALTYVPKHVFIDH